MGREWIFCFRDYKKALVSEETGPGRPHKELGFIPYAMGASEEF